MATKEQQIVGVLGGMGPAATADFYSKLIIATPAASDKDHLRVLIYSNPHIPDRTAAVRGEGPNPLPDLIATAKVLVRGGADFLVMPCVTAHAFFEKLQEATPVPMLHLIGETAAFLRTGRRAPTRLGVLATNGTLQARLFETVFEPLGIRILTPEASRQDRCVMDAIYAVKGGRPLDGPRRWVREAAGHLIARGAEAIVAGCTEIPLLLTDGDCTVPVIDPTWVLAQAAVRRAIGETLSITEPQEAS